MNRAIAAVLVSGACALGWGQAPEPIFHVPFEGDAKAIRAGGKAEPLTAQNLEFRPGAMGQAVSISKDSLLEYAVAKNLMRRAAR